MISTNFTLREATHADLPAMQMLWRDAFGDDDDFILQFYRQIQPRSAILLCGGLAVGMINVCPISLGRLRGGYIYAACVDERYRGRGLFSPLMKWCESLGYDFLFLITEGEHLVPLYRHYGYKTVCAPVLHCDGDILRSSDICRADAAVPPRREGYIERSRSLYRLSVGDMEFTSHLGGAIFRRESENIIKIYELYCSDIISSDIIDIKKVTYRIGMVKSALPNVNISSFGIMLDV